MRLRPFRISEESLVLGWRNHPEVSQFMYRKAPIPDAEHALWFRSALEDSDSVRHRIAEFDGVPVGVCSLTAIDQERAECLWGGYLAPEVARGAGFGRQMIEAALSMAFDELGMQRVFVEVLTSNVRAERLYRSMGFLHIETVQRRDPHSREFEDAYRLMLDRVRFQEGE